LDIEFPSLGFFGSVLSLNQLQGTKITGVLSCVPQIELP
jgi:hypothetical protein